MNLKGRVRRIAAIAAVMLSLGTMGAGCSSPHRREILYGPPVIDPPAYRHPGRPVYRGLSVAPGLAPAPLPAPAPAFAPALPVDPGPAPEAIELEPPQ